MNLSPDIVDEQPKRKSYSAALIDEVRELYPASSEMLRLAQEGYYFLGRYLDDSSQGGFPVDTILLATSLEELQKKAHILKRKKELYSKWYKETRGW